MFTIKAQRISKWIWLQGLNWDLIWDHDPFIFSTFWGSSKISWEITGLFDDFVARFSSLISELHLLRHPLRPPLKGTPAFAPDSAHYGATFATKIWLQNHQTILWSHNLFLMIPKMLKNWTDRGLKWDPNLALAIWDSLADSLNFDCKHSKLKFRNEVFS